MPGFQGKDWWAVGSMDADDEKSRGGDDDDGGGDGGGLRRRATGTTEAVRRRANPRAFRWVATRVRWRTGPTDPRRWW